MNFKLETLIAIRYLRSRRDESFISISSLFSFLGITIGVATLIIVMSVMNGFRAQLIDKIIGINGHLILYFNDESYKQSDLIEKIESIESFLRKFGFGSLTEIDLANERTGILPSRSWKLGTIGENWVVGDTVNMGIGQCYLSVTPIQLAAERLKRKYKSHIKLGWKSKISLEELIKEMIQSDCEKAKNLVSKIN